MTSQPWEKSRLTCYSNCAAERARQTAVPFPLFALPGHTKSKNVQCIHRIITLQKGKLANLSFLAGCQDLLQTDFVFLKYAPAAQTHV